MLRIWKRQIRLMVRDIYRIESKQLPTTCGWDVTCIAWMRYCLYCVDDTDCRSRTKSKSHGVRAVCGQSNSCILWITNVCPHKYSSNFNSSYKQLVLYTTKNNTLIYPGVGPGGFKDLAVWFNRRFCLKTNWYYFIVSFLFVFQLLLQLIFIDPIKYMVWFLSGCTFLDHNCPTELLDAVSRLSNWVGEEAVQSIHGEKIRINPYTALKKV